MNSRTIIAAATVFSAMIGAAFALDATASAGAPEGTKKIMLKISTVETAGTRHQKTWNPSAKPMEMSSKPYSEAQILQATPEQAKKMRDENDRVDLENRQRNAKIAIENWKAADDHMKGLQAQLEGTAYGRQIVLALDKFAGAAGQYFDPDCIEFFHRMDMDEGSKEQFMQDMTEPDMLAAPYFIKMIFDDPREESGIVEMNGQQIKMSKVMQTITYEVQDLQGKMICAGNVKAERKSRQSNAIQRDGTDGNDLVAVLEDALEESAKKINDHFVAKVSFTLTGPKKDEEFDENAGTIIFDGDGHSSGDEFSVVKGKHTVNVEMEGYKRTGSSSLVIRNSGNYKIPMVSSMCDLTVTVKGPAGDEEFDAGNATITLAGEEEFSPSSGEPEKVPQGKYKLTVTMDGYKEFTKEINLAGPKQSVPVMLKKDAVAE